MNPQEQVCHNPRCWVYGRSDAGTIVIHSQREQRYRCKRCGKTFSDVMTARSLMPMTSSL